MSTLSHYGARFLEAYAALHGGRPAALAEAAERRPGEPLEQYLARSRGDALARLQRQLSALEPPPPPLREAHDILVRLLDSAIEADAALAAQVEAYRCGQLQESMAHSDRLQALVAESARLERQLILALRQVESEKAGTLAELGLADIVSPSQMD